MSTYKKEIRKIIRTFLMEGFSRQNYYHYTSINNLKSIIEDDELKRGNTGGISLTRYKNFHKHTDYIAPDVRFELNGDLLHTKYKIKPYMDYGIQNKEGKYIGRVWKGRPDIDYDFIEFEEFVMSPNIKPLSKYLVSISVDPRYYDDLINDKSFIKYIKTNNIKFDILK